MSNIKTYKGTYDYRIDYCKKQLHLTIGIDLNPNILEPGESPNITKYIFTPIDLEPILSDLKAKSEANKNDPNAPPATTSISRNLTICSGSTGNWDRWTGAGNCSFVKTVVELAENGSCGLYFLVAFNPTKSSANTGGTRNADTIHSVYLNLEEIFENYQSNGCTSSEECQDICSKITGKKEEFLNNKYLDIVQEDEDNIIALELAQHDDQEMQYVREISELNNLVDQYYSWFTQYQEYINTLDENIDLYIEYLEKEHGDKQEGDRIIKEALGSYINGTNATWNGTLLGNLAAQGLVKEYLITGYPSQGWGNGQGELQPQWNPQDNTVNSITLYNPADNTRIGEYMETDHLPEVNIFTDFILDETIEKLNGAHTLVESSIVLLNDFWNNCDTDSVGNLRIAGELDFKQSINDISDELTGKCTLYDFPDVSRIPCINFSGIESPPNSNSFGGLKLPCEEDK